jgi:hypothetical protein
MEFIKGGFPKLLPKELVSKDKDEVKPRKFSNKEIITIDEILRKKK